MSQAGLNGLENILPQLKAHPHIGGGLNGLPRKIAVAQAQVHTYAKQVAGGHHVGAGVVGVVAADSFYFEVDLAY